MASNKGTIAILTGGGDVPGLNPAIRAITIRALREGYRVVGIRRGWAGLVDYVRDEKHDNRDNVQELSEATARRRGERRRDSEDDGQRRLRNGLLHWLQHMCDPDDRGDAQPSHI